MLQTKSGHYFVSPDNGSLTAVADLLGIAGLREIDEAVNRLSNSEKSYTFHGRDVYAYTGARLAAGVISFAEVGRKLPNEVVRIPYQKPSYDDGVVLGNIEILDPQFGNIWTNIDRETFMKLGLEPGDTVSIEISEGDRVVLQQTLPYFRMFGKVPLGQPLMYLNSLNRVALALNQGNYAARFGVESGPDWNLKISKN